MQTDERRARLLEMVRGHGFASLPDLARQLEVSESTVRRDLDALEDGGVAKRTHGGVFYTGPSPKLAHFEQRQSVEWNKKKAIARAAAGLIEDGDTLLLDGGSTTYELALLLVSRPLQVVTNSLPVANLFTSSPNTDLVILGGYVHARTGVTLGPYADQMLEGLSVRRAVLSTAGINVEGCFNSNLLLVGTEQAMMRAADEVIIVADSTKFGHTSLSHVCKLDQIDYLVVDDGIADTWRDKLVEAGVQVVIAQENDA